MDKRVVQTQQFKLTPGISFDSKLLVWSWDPNTSTFKVVSDHSDGGLAEILSPVFKNADPESESISQWNEQIKQCLNEEVSNWQLVISHHGVKYDLQFSGFKWPTSTIELVVGTCRDNCFDRTFEQFERAQSDFLDKVFEQISESVVVIDTRGKILQVNQPTLNLFKYDYVDIVGQSINILMPSYYRSRHDLYMKNYQQTGNATIIGKGRELTAVKSTGEEFPMELMISEFHDNQNKLFIGIIRDVSFRKDADLRMQELAYVDAVTRLPNVNRFEEDYEQRYSHSRSAVSTVTIVLIKLDKFYRINQAYSQEFGDEVLCDFKKLLIEEFEEYKVYRGKGSSFIVYCEHNIDANKFCEDISNKLVVRLEHGLTNNGIHVDIDMKLALYNESSKEAATPAKTILSKLALCFKEEYSHDEKIVIFDQTIEHKFLRHFSVEHELNHFERITDQFYLNYQPKFDLDNKLVALEALIRWKSPMLGFVSPAEFIPLAEENGAIINIGHWVLLEGIKAISELNKQGHQISISVNVSANQIVQADFTDKVLDALERFNVAPKQLVLELTETALTKELSTAKENMVTLHKRGVTFSIDDFGTGYSNMNYLSELPVKELKIDKSFVDKVLEDNRTQSVINGIIGLARALHFSIVVEGIETEQQLAYFKSKNLEQYQGYYLSKPAPLKSLLPLM